MPRLPRIPAHAVSRSFCSRARRFDKAILCLLAFAAFGAVPQGVVAGDEAWTDFLAGRIDLDEALAAETTDPGELMVQLLELSEAPGTVGLVARQKLGVLLIKAGRPTDAIPVLETALVASYVADPAAEAFCLLHLGRALVHTRQVEQAAERLNGALTAATELEIPLWAGDAAIALSVLDRWAMDLDSSLAHRQAALESYRAAGYRKGEARARHYIGTIHVYRGELTMAMSTLQEALAVAREAEFTVEITGTLNDLANLNFLLGDVDRALAQYEEAASLTDHPWRRGQLSNNQGTMLADQGRHAEALPYLDNALSLMRRAGDRRLEAEILLSLGRSQFEMKDFDAGVASLDSAISLARQFQVPTTEAYALQYKGCAMLDQGRLDEAVTYLAEAETLATATGFFDVREVCHWARALVERRRGRPLEALEQLRAALAIVDDVRSLSAGSSAVQTGYFSQTRKTFDELIDLLYELQEADPAAGWAEDALAVVQQGKARSFLDQLREAEVELRSLADPQYQERERELLERIATLEQSEQPARIAELENDLALLEADLRRADPRYAELKYPRACTLAEAQNEVLREGELLLEYHLGAQASYLWSIGPGHFGFHRLPPVAEIERQVESLLPMLRDYNLLGDDAAYYTAQAGPLSELLLGPVIDRIARADHVIVAADGALHQLPFAALLTEPSVSRDFSQLPYLVRRTDLSHAPSLSVLQRLRRTPPPTDPGDGGRLLIVASPRPQKVRESGVFARAAGVADLGAVPFAAREVEGVSVSFADERITLLEAGDATAERLREEGRRRHRFIHFVTHGLFNESRPLYSGLVLEPGPASDGFLAVNEIFGLDLDCEQVVLSACSSGRGRNIGGEGLVGMARAFLYAGAEGVTAALWDVPGGGAAEFMPYYYMRLTNENRSTAAAALAGTQRLMIDGDLRRTDGGLAAHPVFWAPFVLTGGR